MLVNQLHQLFHQLAQGPVLRKPGNDDQEAGVAAGQDLQGPDLAPTHLVAADHLPQATALVGTQPLQINDAEQLEERFLHVVQSLEVTGGGSQQHDLGFHLQHLAKLPAEIIFYVVAQCLQVLDHEHELLAQPVRRIQDGGAYVSLK